MRSRRSTRRRKAWICRPACSTGSRARRPRSRGRSPTRACLILAALAAVYIVLGVLYESFIHPITILSTLPSAGVGALLALILFKQDLNVVAIIGIILLIGIVKKNGIMMVDFALEGERERGMNSTRRDLRGLPAALPSDHDDHHGGAAGGHSAGVGHGHGFGTAAATGHCHGGRAAAEPGTYALYHAGDLHLLRSASGTA